MLFSHFFEFETGDSDFVGRAAGVSACFVRGVDGGTGGCAEEWDGVVEEVAAETVEDGGGAWGACAVSGRGFWAWGQLVSKVSFLLEVGVVLTWASRYNWAARKLSRRLEQLGAREFVAAGEGDERHEDGFVSLFTREDELRLMG